VFVLSWCVALTKSIGKLPLIVLLDRKQVRFDPVENLTRCLLLIEAV